MYAVTVRTPNELVVEVIQNGSTIRVKSDKEFNVIMSEKLTDEILRLAESGLVTYAEVSDNTPTNNDNNSRKRNRHKEEESKVESNENPTDNSESTSEPNKNK